MEWGFVLRPGIGGPASGVPFQGGGGWRVRPEPPPFPGCRSPGAGSRPPETGLLSWNRASFLRAGVFLQGGGGSGRTPLGAKSSPQTSPCADIHTGCSSAILGGSPSGRTPPPPSCRRTLPQAIRRRSCCRNAHWRFVNVRPSFESHVT